MRLKMSRWGLRLLAGGGLLMLQQPMFDGRFELSVVKTLAQDAPIAEKQAFGLAKELGTAEAWDAFLTNYPNGFYADLARAYVKKLAEGAPKTQPAPAAQVPQAPATPAPSPAQPDVSSSIPSVTGIVRVTYDGGTFSMTAPSFWVEQRDNGIKLDYTEISRSSDGIELQANSDPNVVITLDVQGRSVLRRAGRSSNKILYEIRKWERSPSASPAASLPPASVSGCDGLETFRSRESKEPAKITFTNSTGTQLLLEWIDFKGRRIGYGVIEPGTEVTHDTYISHPWVVASADGRCRNIYVPMPGSSVARLMPQGNEGVAAAPAPRKVERRAEPERVVEPPLRCGKNHKKVGGECVLMQNCGANAYRSPEGDCYCTKNYQMRNGKCVWKKDKQGFEVAPWKKPGCTSLNWLCKQGSSQACASYESNCQVN